ncbi:nucleolar protein 12-domain-containing protein [Pisolithus tinctorius]|nr:nucleolar protein 12-domain-containing protein [Pisolithus tinctorius]
MQPNSNLAILTQSHKAIAAKRRKKNSQIKEIVFDDDARREFLTGFHKRKLAKKEEAKKRAQLREKQQRLELRRERRRALAERAARNVAEVEKACGAIVDEDDDDGNSIDNDASEIGEEYEGEEQLATVTVVEDFDPAALLHEEQHPKSVTPLRISTSQSPAAVEQTRKNQRQRNSAAKSKSKKRPKVKYQTKAERAAERAKQKSRHTEKAERAGGKASRKKKRW